MAMLLVAGMAAYSDKPKPTGKEPKPVTVNAAEKDTASKSTAGRSTGRDARPAKPDSVVIAAWEKAGAKFGWVDAAEFGEYGMMTATLIPRANDIPGFQFTSRSRLSQSLQGLPPPGIPFAVVSGNADDAELKGLAGLKQLRSLRLRNTQITDVGLQHLEGLTSLRLRDLLGTPITDAGLVHLQGLTKLEHLVILGTQTTDEGVKNLQQALPNCKIIR